MFWTGFFVGILTVFAVCTVIMTAIVIKSDLRKDKKMSNESEVDTE